MERRRADEFLVDAPQIGRALRVAAEEIPGQCRVVLQRQERDAERHVVHELVQPRLAVLRQRIGDHARRQRADFDHVILEAERTRVVRHRAQHDRRIREAVILAAQDELRAADLVLQHRGAVAAEPAALRHRERIGLRRGQRLRADQCGQKIPPVPRSIAFSSSVAEVGGLS